MRTKGKESLVLVHGAWLGGWSWEPVAKVLRKEGYQVFTPDLPGHGNNKKSTQSITLDSYVQAVLQAIDQTDGWVTLVGHSFGGVTVSQAAEQRAHRITNLVYVSAFLLPNGMSLQAACQNVQRSEVLNNLVLSEDKLTVTIKKDVLHQAVAHDIPLENLTGCSTQDGARTDRALIRLSCYHAFALGQHSPLLRGMYGRSCYSTLYTVLNAPNRGSEKSVYAQI